MTLESLGWNDEFAEAFAPYEEQGLVPARVAVQHRGGYVVLTEDGELEAEAARRQVRSGELAGVGDWVALRVLPDGQAIVEAVLPRRTAFTRKETMDRTGEQIVAANVDTVFLVSALGHDLNLRRLERYLTAAWDSGAEPVIVLTKADLHADAVPEARRRRRGDRVRRARPRRLSDVTGEGLDALDPLPRPRADGRAPRLLGRGQVDAREQPARRGADGDRGGARGRRARPAHDVAPRARAAPRRRACCSTRPGMRELQLWDADEEAWTRPSPTSPSSPRECRFSDCTHDHEPGCAVRAALEDGRLAPERWESYRKLQAEIRALEIRQDKRLRSEERKKWRQFSRSMRKAQY